MPVSGLRVQGTNMHGVGEKEKESWAGTIKRYRRANCLTQMALADLMNVDQGTVSRWERGMTQPLASQQRLFRDLVISRENRLLLESIRHSSFGLLLTAHNSLETCIVASEVACKDHRATFPDMCNRNVSAFFTEVQREHSRIMGEDASIREDLCYAIRGVGSITGIGKVQFSATRILLEPGKPAWLFKYNPTAHELQDEIHLLSIPNIG